MSDYLRDRIAEVLHRHWVSEPSGGTATEAWCDCTCGARIAVPGGTRDEASRRGDEHQAQAIIDDLGLRVERANGREETFQRAVGKWER